MDPKDEEEKFLLYWRDYTKSVIHIGLVLLFDVILIDLKWNTAINVNNGIGYSPTLLSSNWIECKSLNVHLLSNAFHDDCTDYHFCLFLWMYTCVYA